MRIQLALKVILFTVLVPGTVVVCVPYLLLRQSGALGWPAVSARTVFGSFLGLCGAGLYAHCVWAFAVRGQGTPAPFDPPKVLVVEGVYKRTRNPMYLGVLCILLCEAMLLGSTLILIYAGIVFVSFHLFVLLYEEPHLRRQYGKVYMDYCRAVPRWWFARRPFNGENRAA